MTGSPVPRSPAQTGLQVEVWERAEVFDVLARSWDSLASDCSGTVFQTAAWARAWWDAFGGGRELHVVAVWLDGRLVALAPFCLERARSGARRLRTVGSPEADYGGVLVACDHRELVVRAMADALYEDRRWDVLWMPDVPPACGAAGELVAALRAKGCFVQTRSSCCYRIPLPTTWEEYLSGLSRGTRKRLLQKARRLVDLGARAVRAAHPVDPAYGIDAFIRLHTAQWRRRGQLGAFADPDSSRFHRMLAAGLATEGRLDLWWLALDGTGYAAVYDFRFGGAVYSYLSAVDPDRLRQLSPGLVLTLWRVRAAIEDGCRWYDLLRGEEAYKETLGARPNPTCSYQVAHRKRWRAWFYLVAAPVRDFLARRPLRPRAQTQETHAAGGT